MSLQKRLIEFVIIFMPLVILHHLLNVFVQLANKRGLKKIYITVYWPKPVVLKCGMSSRKTPRNMATTEVNM
jgi:hypothetical protein